MSEEFKNIQLSNLASEHLCCAIADKKHQAGVKAKKTWLQDRIPEGHTFRKLDQNGKVFIEYAPLETAWVPILGDHYLYIYCLWVSGSFKGKGYGKSLLSYCITDGKSQGKSGICILSSKKKKPFLSEKKFMEKHGFTVVDQIGDYELLALSFNGSLPSFTPEAKLESCSSSDLTIYYGRQCPYIPDCISQIKQYCESHQIPLQLIAVDSLEKAKAVPCVFNNWAVFYKGNLKQYIF